MQKIIIIVAGGKGLRMGHDLPKQFLPIGGKPVLMHTLETFFNADNLFNIILVLPIAQQSYWNDLCSQYSFTIPHSVANGGETRFHSVLNGLSLAKQIASTEALIGIHDGVRPFVSKEVIDACFQTAAIQSAVIPAIDVYETIREINGAASRTVNRSAYKLVQTPQVFQFATVLEAYQQPYNDHFTDDASVVEAMGEKITLVVGNRENIKITTPFDITIAEAILKSK